MKQWVARSVRFVDFWETVNVGSTRIGGGEMSWVHRLSRGHVKKA